MTVLSYELLINILFIITCLFIFQLYIDGLGAASLKQQKIGIFITTGLAIILCTVLPISYGNYYTFDLRQIPFLLGSLTGGPIVAVSLFLVTNVFHVILGGPGILSNLTISFTILILSFFLSEKFNSMSFINRVLFAFGLSIFSSVYTFFVVWLFTGTIKVSLLVDYLIIQAIGMFFISYIAETLKQNFTLKQKVIKTERLEVVTQLAACISHEIRNPLTTSRGFMQLLSERNIDPSDKKFFNLSIQEIDRAEKVVKDFLTFAKPEIKKEEELYLREVLEKCIEILTPLANMSSVNVSTHFTENLTVMGDRSLFLQSLINIIKNCIEAMPNGGDLLIKTGVKSNTNELFIFISDTGIGMSKEQLTRLGEPYFSTKEGKGTGLGMMVVYRIIEIMKGTIKVDSKIGEGSTFTITFKDQWDKVTGTSSQTT
ncbi:MAG: ATP-binding protein [Anaerobacillus sp.]|uniref:ATP-binding protein n=1 Tax=Anaerobacillus sp. TaxID=1872506 RepID=UPI0039190BE6